MQAPPAKYSLTISSSSGGSITSLGKGAFSYDATTEVALVATADAGYKFVKWTGDTGTIANVNSATTTVTVQGNYSITANFEKEEEEKEGEKTPAVERGCFIATAAYGTPMAAEMQVLHEFGDEYLLTNPLGKSLVELYYKVSPPMAEFVTEHPVLKPIVRVGLTPALVATTIVVNTTPAEKALIVGLVSSSVAVRLWVVSRRNKGVEQSLS